MTDSTSVQSRLAVLGVNGWDVNPDWTAPSTRPAVDTSTGAHVITAAQFASSQYVASGITADASHTTPTAAEIIATRNPTWTVANPTAFTLTLTPGSGVTFSGSAVVDSSAMVTYLVSGTAAAAALTRMPITVGIGA